jgi:hypothetical protein
MEAFIRMRLDLKRFSVLLLLLCTTACLPAGQKPPLGVTIPTAGASAPVYVPALCTLMGGEVRSDVPAGHPVILMWGWSAATEEQIREYIRVSTVVVTFDGTELSGRQQGGIPYDKTARMFKAVWMSDIGIPKPGIHAVTYLLTFREKLFDGFDYYGPGTDKEKQEDKCEIEVK